LSSIFNDSTKLFFYLVVWYLGNIYCKCLYIQLNWSSHLSL
jgi:hypothetical protein